MTSMRRQRGFAYIAAIVLLVVMATMATAMVRLNAVQQTSANQDVLGSRASAAARAGVEWGLFQLRGGTCNSAGQSLTDFTSATGFVVTVKCNVSGPYNEGGTSAGPTKKYLYQIDAVACNVGAACPNDAQVTNVDYVERRRVATACLTAARDDCY